MILPRETEAGSAGMQPCRGITWWAHRDDDRGRGNSSCALPNFIGSKDPHALKIPARKGGIRLTNENAAVPVHADQDNREFYPNGCWRKRRNLRQVESNERCCSSESQLWMSGPPSSSITSKRM